MIWFITSGLAWLGLFASKKYYGIPFLLLIVFLLAFRYYVGSDFDDYVNLYDHVALGKLIPVEPSYFYISSVLNYFGFNFQAIIALYAVLTYFFVYLGLKEVSEDKKIIGVMIFFVYLIFFFPSMSIMRQALAASIVFWGVYRFLFRRQYLRFLLVIAVSIFFHVSSVFYLLLIPFYLLKPKPLHYVLIMVVAAFLGLTFSGTLIGYLVDFLGVGFKNYIFQSTPLPPPVFLLNTAIIGIVFLYLVFSKVRKDYFLLNIIFFILVIRLLSVDFLALNRVSAGFTLFIVVFVTKMVYERLSIKSMPIFYILCLILIMTKSFFTATKDYSYYQYSINFCILGDPCPISIIGDLPLEELLTPEVLR